MKADPLNIIITGVGGQGNVLASHVIALAAIESGFHAVCAETYGASQRGGSVMSHVRLSKKRQYAPVIPKANAHVIVGFEPVETLRVLCEYGNRNTDVIVNPRPVYPIETLSGVFDYPSVKSTLSAVKKLASSVQVVEATEMAKRAGDALSQNIVMVGCLAGSGLIPVKVETFKKVIRAAFDKKYVELNIRALDFGVKEVMGEIR